jgi:hypothetical protein
MYYLLSSGVDILDHSAPISNIRRVVDKLGRREGIRSSMRMSSITVRPGFFNIIYMLISRPVPRVLHTVRGVC